MIVIDKLSKISLFFVRPLLLVKKIYYYEKDKELNTSNKSLIQLTFDKKYAKSKDLVKKWNIGDEIYIKKYYAKYKRLDINYNKLFQGIKNINDKLKIIFISSLRIHQIGSINIHYDLYHSFRNDEKLCIIHSNIHSFMCKENASFFNVELNHFYIPVNLFFP